MKINTDPQQNFWKLAIQRLSLIKLYCLKNFSINFSSYIASSRYFIKKNIIKLAPKR